MVVLVGIFGIVELCFVGGWHPRMCLNLFLSNLSIYPSNFHQILS
jgi:hypothetical protein